MPTPRTVLVTYVTADLKAAFEAAAEREGLSASAVLRRCALEYATVSLREARKTDRALQTKDRQGRKTR